ncbi:MAG: 1-acylglycerol-3-phosphate O-acyltransferase [Bdellovibrio sp.]|nr:1-acylglycerol-3-phosphate O-acyltransferase [Bdellovibrio sp.]
MLKLVRYILITLLVVGALLLALLIAFFRPFSDKNATLFARMIGPLGLKLLGVEYEILGAQYLERKEPCIYIGNHQNNFDIFIVCSFIPTKTISLGKIELLWIPIFGIFFVLSGNIVVNRGNRLKSMQSMEKVKRLISERKLSIVIMPEGTRSKGRGLLPFKKGAFHTAVYTGVPVVPFCVSSWEANINLNRWNAGKLIIKVLPPLNPNGTSSREVDTLLQQSRALMEKEINQLNVSLQAARIVH